MRRISLAAAAADAWSTKSESGKFLGETIAVMTDRTVDAHNGLLDVFALPPRVNMCVCKIFGFQRDELRKMKVNEKEKKR